MTHSSSKTDTTTESVAETEEQASPGAYRIPGVNSLSPDDVSRAANLPIATSVVPIPTGDEVIINGVFVGTKGKMRRKVTFEHGEKNFAYINSLFCCHSRIRVLHKPIEYRN